MVTKQRTLREDPREAVLQVIEHNLTVMKNVHDDAHIVVGKIGRTTSTFFPDANAESTSVDGYSSYDASTSGWATIQPAATGGSASDTDASSNSVYIGAISPWSWLYRAFYLFDTSAIGTDTIDSATFNL